MFQDLNMVTAFGKFDMDPNDTLVFVKILSATSEGLSGLTENINTARAWIATKPEIFTWPLFNCSSCCDTPGDATNNGTVNILDITFLINYLYMGGPEPECLDEGDANGNGTINILDITYLINYLYMGGPAPSCPS
jgi:hypothetical protein